MKLLEYEAKALLHHASLPVPKSHIIRNPSEAEHLGIPVVLKSQVPVGGRGKLGGISIIENAENLLSASQRLFGLSIKGFTPSILLAEEKIAIKKEFYVSLLVDRESSSIRLIAHNNGGIEVEANDSSDFFNQKISRQTLDSVISQLAHLFELPFDLVQPFVTKLYNTFTSSDATLLEINPLILTNRDELVCGDCKIELDDAAAFRHPNWNFEDSAQNTNFVTLHADGTVATIANGAGLAMATVDAVAAKNMKPANFLDIGGGANTESVLKAFTAIAAFPEVKAIVINIFAGITRCDEVARAIIAAKKQLPALPPLFIRLAGTHFKEAVALLDKEDIPTLDSLDECLEAAKEVVYA